MTKNSACVILFNNKGQILITSRRKNPNKWSLPGGKVEVHETLEDAAARELFEETGYVLTSGTLEALFVDHCCDDKDTPTEGHFVCTFVVRESAENYQLETAIEAGDITLKWVDSLDFLCDPVNTPFWKYNSALKQKLESLNW